MVATPTTARKEFVETHHMHLFNVPSGSLAEDPEVYATPVRCSEYPGRCLERKEPQGPLRETLRKHDENLISGYYAKEIMSVYRVCFCN